MVRPPLPDPGSPAVFPAISRILNDVHLHEYDGKTVFMTGATGFFGYWMLSLFACLRQMGLDVRVRALSRAPAAFLERASYFGNCDWLSWVQGDVKSFLDDAHIDLFIHAATDTHQAAHQKPINIVDDVLLGTRHALEHARKYGARRFLYVSSGAIYGKLPLGRGHFHETDSVNIDPLDDKGAYGIAKLAAEQWCQQFSAMHAMAFSVARCFAFIGPGLPLNGHFAIGNFIADCLEGRLIHVKGNGAPVRSYLYGADLAVWLAVILARGASGRAYNVGSDAAWTIRDLAVFVRDTLAPEMNVLIEDKLTGQDSARLRYIPSIDRARDELGLDVWTGLRDAVVHTAYPEKVII